MAIATAPETQTTAVPSLSAAEAPSPESGALDPQSFRKRLEDEIKGRHSAVAKFSQLWANGDLTRQQLGVWVKQHYGYVGTFTDWLGVMYAKCPHRDAKDFLLQNMWEEEMGQRHTDLLIRFGEACGVTRQEIEAEAEIFPETRALRAWCRDLASNSSYLEATAGLIVGLESQVPAIYMKQLPVLKEKYGYGDEDVKFFKIHITSDIVHGERGFQIVLKYATTGPEQDACLERVRQGTRMRRLYMDGLYRRAVLGETD